jgi:integrase
MGRATYQKVFDDRKRRMRGLWKRNDHFYARLVIVDEATGHKVTKRVRLEKARTVAEARTALQDLQKDRREENLPVLKQSPKLTTYWEEYFKFYASAKDAKRHGTLRLEQTARKSWLEYLPALRLKDITRKHINGFIADRQEKGLAARSVNLYVIALRNLLKRAKEEGLIKVLPTENLRPLKVNQRKRRLYTPEEMEQLYTAAAALPRSGQMLADILRLMSTCGSRISETLRLKWSDADFKQNQITIGSDGLAKNRKHRVVDFNTTLEDHLKDMQSRKQPDSNWLFPSPRRGKKDVPLVTFNKALLAARVKAALPEFSFHDCRHYFVSHCVMAGIDFMTIARWIGHQDGGILIGKVYGHLSNEHAQRQAKKIDFGGTKLEQNQAPAQAKEKTTIEPAEVAQENQSPPE